VKDYFFYYFGPAPDAIPYFEVVACADDADAESRCRGVLVGRGAGAAEVWLGDRMVCRVESPKPNRFMPPKAGTGPVTLDVGS